MGNITHLLHRKWCEKCNEKTLSTTKFLAIVNVGKIAHMSSNVATTITHPLNTKKSSIVKILDQFQSYLQLSKSKQMKI
jgi:hypothetical protein